MRRRRFVVAVLAVGLVFGITLLLDGFTHSIDNEIRRTVGAFRADTWLVSNGSSGPFTPDHLVSESAAAAATSSRPAVGVDPTLALPTPVARPGGSRARVNIIGTTKPVHLQSGRWPSSAGEVV